MKPFTAIAVVVLAFVAAIHVLRLVKGVELLVNGTPIPLWVSAVAALLTGGLAIMVWREAQRR